MELYRNPGTPHREAIELWLSLLEFRSSAQIWAELHEKAFRRLDGVTHVVVLENLKEGVLTPDIYDPPLNLYVVMD